MEPSQQSGKLPYAKLAAFSYLVFFAPRFTAAKVDPFVRYHMMQSTGLIIVGLAAQGVISLLGYWGMGYGLLLLLAWALRIFLAGEAVIGIRNALAGKTAPLPVIGKYSAKLTP